MNGKFSYKDQNLDRPACKLVYICCIFGKFEMDNDWLLMPLEELQFLAQQGRDGFIFQPLWLPLGLFCVKKKKKRKRNPNPSLSPKYAISETMEDAYAGLQERSNL